MSNDVTPSISPAPNPTPRRPQPALPAGAVDCHAHVFLPAEQAPYAARRPYTPPPGIGLAQYLAMHDAIGISRGVLVNSNIYGPDHTAMLDALRRHPEWLRGVALVDPGTPDAELEALHAAGVRAARINLKFPGELSLEQLPAMAPRLAALGWHLEVLAYPEQLADVAAPLMRLSVPIVIDHMMMIRPEHGVAHPGFQAGLAMLRGGAGVKLSNAYRLSGGTPPYAEMRPFVQAMVEANPAGCVWGTNWPHPLPPHTPDDGDLVDSLTACVDDAALRHAILVDNPARMYGFAPTGE